jgi:hypothetical protein
MQQVSQSSGSSLTQSKSFLRAPVTSETCPKCDSIYINDLSCDSCGYLFDQGLEESIWNLQADFVEDLRPLQRYSKILIPKKELEEYQAKLISFAFQLIQELVKPHNPNEKKYLSQWGLLLEEFSEYKLDTNKLMKQFSREFSEDCDWNRMNLLLASTQEKVKAIETSHQRQPLPFERTLKTLAVSTLNVFSGTLLIFAAILVMTAIVWTSL